MLDRTNGEFLSGTPFVYVELDDGLRRERPAHPGAGIEFEPARAASSSIPRSAARTNFQAPSYSPLTGWMYLEYGENGQRYVSAPETFEAGKQYIGRTTPAAADVGPKPGEPERSAGIKALDPETGKTMWDFKIFQGSLTNGVLATGGNVVFGAIRDGNLVALDARTRQTSVAFPDRREHDRVADELRVGGRQFVAIAAGNTVYAFALPE